MRTTWVLLLVATLSLALSVNAEPTGQDERSSELGRFPTEAPRVGRRGLLDDGGIAALLDASSAPSYGYYYGGASLPALATKLDSLRRRLLADEELDSLLTVTSGPGAYGYGYSSYGSGDSSFTRRLLQLDDAGLLSEASGTPGYGGYGYYPSTSRRLLSTERLETLGRRLLQQAEFLSLTESEGTYGYGYYPSVPTSNRRLLSVASQQIDAIRRNLLASEDSFLTSETPGSGGYGYYYGGQLPSRRLLATQLESIHRKLLADDDGLANMLEALGPSPGYGYGYGYASGSGRRLLAANSEKVDDVIRKLMQ